MRRVQAPAVAQVVVALPWCAASGVILVLLTTPIGELAGAWPDPWEVPGRVSSLSRVVLVGWGLSGAVMLWPRAEAVLARRVWRFRRPYPGEAAALGPAWRAVRERAGIPAGNYTLWVQPSDEVNAIASAGHTIAVTRRALKLPPHQLSAVLAHELGHHLGTHALATGLAHWYSLPARLALRLARAVVAFVMWLSCTLLDITVRVAAVLFPAGGCLLSLAELAVRLVMLVLSLGVFVVLACVPAGLAWFSRLGETQADRMAARLGYGDALVEVLRSSMGDDDQARARASRMTLLLATHPSMRTRIRALHRYLGRKPLPARPPRLPRPPRPAR